ncbi:MAG: DUF3892 domain-containing protein [Flavobacteriales bacterium]|tara:strand:- start:2078 stop:2380 length:303 start_codon:yes stop_codon:yes gene_type:complete
MAKWADYLISHVRRDSNGNVTSVLMHEDKGESILQLGIKTKNDVITLIKKGYTFKTVIWGYPKWNKGADVHIVKIGNEEFIRTDRNKTGKDNLDNLIPLN